MKEQIRVHLDFETFSEADLKAVGGAAYARHDSTRILMAAWCYETGAPKQWDHKDGPMPQELRDILENKDGKYMVCAQNAGFEIMITIFNGSWLHDLDVPYGDFSDRTTATRLRRWLGNWRCTMVMGFGLSLPGSLKDVGKILQMDPTLLKSAANGERLIRLFCMPVRKTKANPDGLWTSHNAPDKYDEFLEYNRQDVIAERANYEKILPYNTMPDIEWGMWHLDQTINLTGMRIDTDLVESAMVIDKAVQDRLGAEMKKLTGLGNPNSIKQLVKWLNFCGVKVDNARKATIEALTKRTDLKPKVCRVLELRQATSKSSNKKFEALFRAVCGEADDGVLRGVYQYGGAQRTRRWAGRIFQPQNLPRGELKTRQQMETAIAAIKLRDPELMAFLYGGYENVPNILSSVIRNAVIARKGKVLTVADLASIETVMTWWAADAEGQLDKIRHGVDAYIDYATKLLDKDYDEVTKAERTYAKPAVLGCCYRLGGPGLVAYAESMGVKMTRKEGYRAVDIYRQDNPEVVSLWDKLENAFKTCMVTGEDQYVNGKFRFRAQKPCIFIDLPSGRSLCYVQPKILPRTITFEDRDTGKPVKKEIMSITYMGVDQYTRQWTRQDTHGGKLLENIIQAIARDILRDAMLSIEGMHDVTLIGHVHDEVITETPDSGEYRHLIENALTCSSPWCADAPLGASSYQAPFFLKD